MAKPIKSLELHYPMIYFFIIIIIFGLLRGKPLKMFNEANTVFSQSFISEGKGQFLSGIF